MYLLTKHFQICFGRNRRGKNKKKIPPYRVQSHKNLEPLPISMANTILTKPNIFSSPERCPRLLVARVGSASCQPQPWYSLQRGDTVGHGALVAADALVLGDADLPAQLVRQHASMDRGFAQQRRLKGNSHGSGNHPDKPLMPSLPGHRHTGVTAHNVQQKLKRNQRRGGRGSSNL